MTLPSSQSRLHPYFGQVALLTTMHKKQQLIQPPFFEILGMEVIEHNADTDQFGTFSGEIERAANPKQTAISKARLGMTRTGMPIGIASEGSVGPDAQMPFANSNTEHMVFLDDINQIQITQTYKSFDIVAVKEACATTTDLEKFIDRADFPTHKLIASPQINPQQEYIKGIETIPQLESSIWELSKKSSDGLALIQSDFRAHCSPSRQRNIRVLAGLLANRLSQQCPECQAPGWGSLLMERGLTCDWCGLLNAQAPKREVFGCSRCPHTIKGPKLADSADPASCLNCNP
jgi:hypothetical protein